MTADGIPNCINGHIDNDEICILQSRSAYAIMPLGKKLRTVHTGRQETPVLEHRGFSIPNLVTAGLRAVG